MTVALWCLAVVALLPIVCAGISKWGLRGCDNSSPRDWLARQVGWRARAHAAQQNSWEALAMFTAAIAAAHFAAAPQPRVDALALGFLGARLLYILLYVTDRATLRSLVWTAGVACCVALFLAGA